MCLTNVNPKSVIILVAVVFCSSLLAVPHLLPCGVLLAATAIVIRSVVGCPAATYSTATCFLSVAVGLGTVQGQVLPSEGRVERLATGYNFTEGPVYDGMGGLFFTNILFNGGASQIIRYDETSGATEIVDANSGQANGLFFDQNQQLVSMDMRRDRRQVSRRSPDDISVVSDVLATEWDGKRFNSTNDLVIAEDGGIYFTDPDYLGRAAQPDAVYYLAPDGELTQIMSGMRRPNGIILSPNEETLYLAVSDESRIMAFDVGPDGLPANGRQFASTSGAPDGMTVDGWGNVYAAVGNKVSVWNPEGQTLFDIRVPERASNVTFGGTDGDMLYITARNSLYRIAVNYRAEWDIDELTQEVLAGTNNPRFDLTGDGLVDEADRVHWVKELNNTFFGDADLNGEFNSSDLIGSLAAGAYERDVDATWSSGDFDGSGRFDSSDLILALSDGGYEAGPRAAVNAVPEPSTMVLLGLGMLALRRFTRLP